MLNNLTEPINSLLNNTLSIVYFSIQISSNKQITNQLRNNLCQNNENHKVVFYINTAPSADVHGWLQICSCKYRFYHVTVR